MIHESDLFPIGKIIKQHGVKGELACELNSDAIDLDDYDYIVLDIDGIFVPFFVDSVRYKSDTALLLMLDGIADESLARAYKGKTIFVEQQLTPAVEAKDLSLDYFIGFSLVDNLLGAIGSIDDVDERTANALFVVGDKLIPVSEEFITEIDHKGRILHTRLPEGLLDL